MKTALMVVAMSLCMGSAISTQAQPVDVSRYPVSPAPALNVGAGTYRAPGMAVIRNLSNGATTRELLEHSDEIYSAPQPNDPINNDPGFAFPINPHDPRIALVLFTVDGQSKRCVGAAVGRRLILTAGHCVSSRDSGQFATGVSVIPGYDSDSNSNVAIPAARLVTFSGWLDGKDNAHDIGVIELAADLPSNVVPYRLASFGPACPAAPVLAYQKRYYSPALANGGKQFWMDHTYLGCHLGTLYHRQPTAQGSSGSPSVSMTDQGTIISVVSAGTNVWGYDARLTKGKLCYITTKLMIGICQ